MGFYREHVIPRVINWVCASEEVSEQRRKVVPLASGQVLEVGMGPALNLRHYDREKVDKVWGLEPSQGMRRFAEPRLARASDLEVEWLDLPGEQIPLDDDSIDSIVLTYTLCSIPDWRTALGQMRRVLRPGGKVFFSEHGQAPDAGVARWQSRVDPIWTRLAGGCHLDRPIRACFEEEGFEMETIDTEYRGIPRAASFTYWGIAVPSEPATGV